MRSATPSDAGVPDAPPGLPDAGPPHPGPVCGLALTLGEGGFILQSCDPAWSFGGTFPAAISNVKIANLFGSVEDHPWPRMREAGLHLTLNTDDPAMIGDDLGTEYATLARAHGYSFADMVEISLAGADATWQGDDERRQLRERIREEGTKLQRALDARTTKGTPEGAPFDTPPPDR